MSRKYWPYIFVIALIYWAILRSAYQWGDSQRLPDGSIFEHLAHQEREKALAAIVPTPPPESTPDSRFRDAGPAFVAVRRSPSQILFMVDETSVVFGRHSGHPQRISVSAEPTATLAGLRDLWAPTSEVWDSLPGLVKSTPKGQQWVLQLSSDANVPVTIDRAVLADTGCSLSVGFLATVASGKQREFAAAPQDYFVIHRFPTAPAERPQSPDEVLELPDLKPAPEFEEAIARQLNQRMHKELLKVHSELMDNQEHIEQREETWPFVRPVGTWLAQWIQIDQQLQNGKAKLSFQTKAFRVTPDGTPRLFVRARWEIAGKTAFLMSAWFRGDPTPLLLNADARWSNQLRQGKLEYSFLDHREFQDILNVFDADRDGLGELLVYNQSAASSRISLYRYNDLGLIPMKASLRRDTTPRATCEPGLQAKTEVE